MRFGRSRGRSDQAGQCGRSRRSSYVARASVLIRRRVWCVIGTAESHRDLFPARGAGKAAARHTRPRAPGASGRGASAPSTCRRMPLPQAPRASAPRRGGGAARGHDDEARSRRARGPCERHWPRSARSIATRPRDQLHLWARPGAGHQLGLREAGEDDRVGARSELLRAGKARSTDRVQLLVASPGVPEDRQDPHRRRRRRASAVISVPATVRTRTSAFLPWSFDSPLARSRISTGCSSTRRPSSWRRRTASTSSSARVRLRKDRHRLRVHGIHPARRVVERPVEDDLHRPAQQPVPSRRAGEVLYRSGRSRFRRQWRTAIQLPHHSCPRARPRSASAAPRLDAGRRRRRGRSTRSRAPRRTRSRQRSPHAARGSRRTTAPRRPAPARCGGSGRSSRRPRPGRRRPGARYAARAAPRRGCPPRSRPG